MLVLSALLLLIGLCMSVAFATGALGSPATSKRKMLFTWQAVGGILIVCWGLYGLAWLIFTPAVGRSAIAVVNPGALMPTATATQALPSPTTDPNAAAGTVIPTAAAPTSPAITPTSVPSTSTVQATAASAGTAIPTAVAPTAGPLPVPTIDPVIAARFPQFTPAGTNISVNQLLWLKPDATAIDQLPTQKVRILAEEQLCPFNGGSNRCNNVLRAGNFMVLNADQVILPGFGSINGSTRLVMYNLSKEDAVWSGENQATIVNGNVIFGRINQELGQTEALAMIQAISDRALGAAQGTNATFMVVYVNYSESLGWTYQIVN